LGPLRHNREPREGVIVSALTTGQRLGRGAIALVAVGALALQGGVAWGATWVVENEQNLKDRLVAYQFDPSEDIKRYVEQAGLSANGELYMLASLPKVVPAYEFDRYCSRSEPGIGVLGCYTLRDRRIYLYDVTDPRLVVMEPVIAAHEMLHAAWARLSVAEQERIAVLLEEGFAPLPADHELRTRIASYEDNNPASRIPELYSILGTELGTLPTELEEHYSIYFDDRSKVVALAQDFFRVFETLVAERDQLLENLESRGAEIDGLNFTYNEANAALSRDIDAFEVRRTTPGGYPSQSEFLAARASLIERQDRSRSLRSTLIQKIEEYNTLLEDFTRLNTELSELNRGINITIEEKDELSPDTETIEE
jgi:hypothetical protein